MTRSAVLREIGIRVGATVLYRSGTLRWLQRRYVRRRLAETRAPVEPFLVLLYHRVNADKDPLFPAIAVSHFEEQIRYLAHNFRVLSLGEIVRRLQGGLGLEPLTVAITFDD